LREIEKRTDAYEMLAYADDLCIIGTADATSDAFNEISECLAKFGLYFNTDKC